MQHKIGPNTGMDSDSYINGVGGPNQDPGTYFENNLNQPLLDNQSQYQEDTLGKDEKYGCWYKMKRTFGWTVSKEKRTIYLNGKTLPQSFPSNKLNNQKYTFMTFLPKLLYNEFKFFFNMFFLLIAIS